MDEPCPEPVPTEPRRSQRTVELPDVTAVQSKLLRDNLELFINNIRRLPEMSVQAADQAAQTITAEARESAKRARRVA